MSQGNSPTKRQRRGHTVAKVSSLPPLGITLGSINAGAGTIGLQFNVDVVISTDPDDWLGVLVDGNPGNPVASITSIGARSVTLHYTDPIAGNEMMSYNGTTPPVVSSLGQQMTPWLNPDLSGSWNWPPG